MKKTCGRIIVIFLVSTAFGEISSIEPAQLSQCGANSLYLCLKYHKIEANLEDMYSDIRPDVKNNVSLKQLADYTKIKGLYVKAIIKPSAADIEQLLNSNTSMIVQYVSELPDTSKLKHIVGLVKPDQKIMLLDYPKKAQDVSNEDLAKMASLSDGLLVLSKSPIVSMAEFFDFKSLKSVSFYLMTAGMAAAAVIFVSGRRKKNKEATGI